MSVIRTESVLGEDLRFRRLGDEGVLISQSETPRVAVVNGLGIRVLELLQQGLRFGGLVEALALEHDVDSAIVRGDVRAYLSQLEDHGFLDLAPGFGG